MSDRNLRIRMLLEAGDRVTRPLRNIAGGSAQASQALKVTRDNLKLLQRAQGDVASFRALREGLRDTTRALAAAKTRVAEATAAIAASDAPTRKMATELARAEREATKLTASQRQQASALRLNRAGLREAGASVRDLATYEQRLGRQIDDTTRSMDKQARHVTKLAERQKRMSDAREGFGRVQNAAGGLAAGGASGIATAITIGAPIAVAARSAMSLEEGMAGVAKVTGMAAGPLANMQDRLVTLTARIPMTAVELSNIAAAAGAAGVGMDKFGRPLRTQAADLVTFTDSAARMGIAFDQSAEEAGSTMAKWRQAFKMTQPEAEALGDQINALTNKFGGKAANVSDIVTRIGPLAKVAGAGAREIAALGSSLDSIGVESDVASTGIKNTLLALTKGEAATKSQNKAYEALGLTSERVAARMQMDASGTIIDVFTRISKIRPDKQAAMLDSLFGSESIGAIAPILNDLDGFKNRLALVGNASKYAGSMTREFQSRINTTKGATDLAGNAFQAVNISLGQILLPTIKSAAQTFSSMATRTRAWAKENPALARGAMFLAVGLAGLFGIFGVGAIALAGIMAPIAIVNAGLIAMGVAGGLASIGLLPIIGTVAAIVAGVALLGTAAYLIYQNWGAVAGFFGNLWTGIQSTFQTASAAVVGVFRGMWTGVKSLFSLSLLDVLGGIASFVGYALGSLYRFGAAAFGWLTGTLPGLLASGWNAAWTMLTGAITASWSWLTTQLPTMLANGWRLAWAAFTGAVRAAFVTLPAMFFNFGAMIVKGLWNGIKAAPGKLVDAGKALATSLAGGFRKGADIHSPSRVFARLGGYVTSGLAGGIDRGAAGPVDRIARLTRGMIAAMPAALPMPAFAADQAVRIEQSRQIASAIVPAGGVASGTAGGSAPIAAAPAGKIEIHIHQLPGQSPQDLARIVAEEVAKAQRGAAARGSSSFGDKQDWND